MARFEKTTKTEKIIITVLLISLSAGLVILFARDKGTRSSSNQPSGTQLINPVTSQN